MQCVICNVIGIPILNLTEKKVLPFRTIICIVETITDEFLIETLKQWKQKNNNIVITTTKGNDSIY